MKYLIYLLLALPALAFGTLNEVDKQLLAAKNLLTNGGFENGKAGTSASGGSYTLTTYDIPTNGISGKVTASWDPSAADQYLNLGTITYYRWSPVAQKNGIALCSFRSGYSDYTLEVYDGTNVIASQVLSTGGTTSLTKKEYVNFAFPTTTLDSAMTITVRLKSTADAVAVLVDDCFLGLADEVNLSAVKPVAYLNATSDTSQTSTTAAPKIYEDLVFSTNITYNTGTGVATIQIPGKYRINASTGCGTSVVGLAVYKNGSIALTGYYSTGNSGGRTGVDGFLDLVVGDTIDIRPGASTCASGTDGTLNFVNIELIDTAQGTAYRPDAMANSWSGYHDNTCSWARTNTAYGDPATDASCALTERLNTNFGTVSGSNSLPSITFTPKKAQKYFVCATPSVLGASSGADLALKLWDGTTTIAERDLDAAAATTSSTVPLCGIYSAQSTAAKTISIQTKASTGAITIQALTGASAIEWSIFAIDQQIPAPLLVNSVVSAYAGVWSSQSARIDGTVSPSTVSQESGDWIDGDCTRNATGRYTCTIKAGVFSSAPNCFGNVEVDGTTSASVNIISLSSTQLVVETAASAQANWAFYIKCEGPK